MVVLRLRAFNEACSVWGATHGLPQALVVEVLDLDIDLNNKGVSGKVAAAAQVSALAT